nr:hypothetical protein GCM10020185_25690 [Pseudomonas brassicacearum subsp. brassicacearum]
MLTVAQVLQLAVAGQLLAAQRNQRIERRQLGVELVALLGAQGFASVSAGLEDGVDLLDAGLAVGDFRLGPLGAGLGGDDQTVGVSQGFLQVTLLCGAIREHLLELGNWQVGVALRHRHHRGALEPRQFALVLDVLLGRSGQLLFERLQLLFVVGLVAELGQRVLQDRLQGFLLGFRQFAVGDFVQAGLH